MGSLWSKEEDAILLQYYEIYSNDKLAEMLPERGKRNIIKRANLLGLRKPVKLVYEDLWSESEDEIIKKHYGKVPPKILMDMLPGRTTSSIRKRAYRHGINSGKGFKGISANDTQAWSEKEIEILFKHGATMRMDQLLKLLPGRTCAAVRRKCQKLGIAREYQKRENERKKEYKVKVRKPRAKKVTPVKEVVLPPVKKDFKKIESEVKRRNRLGEEKAAKYLKSYKRPSLKQAIKGLTYIPELKMAIRLQGRTKAQIIEKYTKQFN